jgi:hypothetical protein
MKIVLPTANIARWTVKAKLAVCDAIALGELSRDAAKARYSLTDAELDSWINREARHGMPGLRVTRLKQYR